MARRGPWFRPEMTGLQSGPCRPLSVQARGRTAETGYGWLAQDSNKPSVSVYIWTLPTPNTAADPTRGPADSIPFQVALPARGKDIGRGMAWHRLQGAESVSRSANSQGVVGRLLSIGGSWRWMGVLRSLAPISSSTLPTGSALAALWPAAGQGKATSSQSAP